MADEPRIMYELASWAHLPAAHGRGPDRHIRVFCDACGAWDVVELGQWPSARWGQRLPTLVAEMLCRCGSRRLRGEIWSGAKESQTATGLIARAPF